MQFVYVFHIYHRIRASLWIFLTSSWQAVHHYPIVQVTATKDEGDSGIRRSHVMKVDFECAFARTGKPLNIVIFPWKSFIFIGSYCSKITIKQTVSVYLSIDNLDYKPDPFSSGSTDEVSWEISGQTVVESIKGSGYLTFLLEIFKADNFSNKIPSSDYPLEMQIDDMVYLQVNVNYMNIWSDWITLCEMLKNTEMLSQDLQRTTT